nr:hypothetical protein [Tanacetum cinerariifolium]
MTRVVRVPICYKDASNVNRVRIRIRSKPRWETSILSDFPDITFVDTAFLKQLVLCQGNVFFSLRLLYWLHLRFGYVPDQTLCGFVFNELVNHNAAKAAKKFIEFTRFVPENGGLELYVKCLCENGMVEDALHVFDQMEKNVDYPSLETWNVVLKGCVKVGWTDVVWELYGEMMELGVVADVETVDCLIHAFCLDGNVTKGYQVLRQMLDDGLIPRKQTFENLIGVLSEMNKLDVGLIAFGHMFKIGYIPSLRLETIALTSCHKKSKKSLTAMKAEGFLRFLRELVILQKNRWLMSLRGMVL